MDPRLSEQTRSWWRDRLGQRAIGAVLALAVEALLVVLFLWWLAPFERERREVAMSTFDVAAPPAPEAAEDAASPAAAAAPQPEQPQPEPPPDKPPPQPTPPVEVPPPAIVPLTPQQMAAADITRVAPPPAAPPAPRRVYGPPAPPGRPRAADSEVVGTAPNGQPLYAASWYREPYPEELRGYLSTASGPGWGLIACRTVPEWRVEDCEGLEEYPRGSNIMRSVLAAAWQFKVRPPTVGGKPQYGEWVRIRIDYGIRPR